MILGFALVENQKAILERVMEGPHMFVKMKEMNGSKLELWLGVLVAWMRYPLPTVLILLSCAGLTGLCLVLKSQSMTLITHS